MAVIGAVYADTFLIKNNSLEHYQRKYNISYFSVIMQ